MQQLESKQEQAREEDWRRALEAHVSGRPWRSFAELLDSAVLREELALEFPAGADLPPSEASRREFLKLLGASVALAGLSGCTRAPSEQIVPYTGLRAELTPGTPTHYATAMTLGGYATGLLVESHEGRPTKVEGNPNHPSSLGATGALEQASVLSLYDPSRARALRSNDVSKSFSGFIEAFAGRFSAGKGEGLHVLMEPTASPTTLEQLARLSTAYPRSQLHFHTPLSREAAWSGSQLVFGRPLDAQLDLTRADVVVALDSDLLADGPNRLRYARDFARSRRVRSTSDRMNRLYVVESALTVTGGMADHRLRVRHSDVLQLAVALLAELAAVSPPPSPQLPAALAPVLETLRARGEHAAWIAALARDLRAHAGRSIVVVGDAQPAVAHALSMLINHVLGNLGTTLTFTEPVLHQAGSASHRLDALVGALDAGTVETLLILDGNPVYTAPVDLELARRLHRSRERVYLGLYDNETARQATWFVPQTHYLEAWGDARAYDGTTSIVQPLIEPLYQGHTIDEVLAVFAGGTLRPNAHALVREHWRTHESAGPDAGWERALQRGVVDGTAQPRVAVSVTWEQTVSALSAIEPASGGIELAFTRDARVHDGAFTNNGWLLELPDPITKLTWENALLISPKTAAQLGVGTEDVVDVKLRGRSLSAPVLVAPGHADDAASLALGYGRSGAEALARGLGVNAYALRNAAAPYFELGAIIEKRAGKHQLASTQEHWSMQGRDLIRHASLDEYKQHPSFAKREQPTTSLYKLPLLGSQQWGMSIDLNACTGCSACVVACQAENNTPIVGKEGVSMSREMHWLRIDRYFEGSASDPSLSVQPMLCQHCEKAPCEYVCPVNATVHSPDGLNEQVYNRCVGTRFCSNNCAWKVRRFNWFNYHVLAARQGGENAAELHAMVMNPDVTVRARGVMEKCTYCVQRIREKEIGARTSGVPLADGDVVTACAQACPSQAIVFGSLTMPGAEVKQLRDNERDYAVLGELGTEPRTRYLARLRNPNPDVPQ